MTGRLHCDENTFHKMSGRLINTRLYVTMWINIYTALVNLWCDYCSIGKTNKPSGLPRLRFLGQIQQLFIQLENKSPTKSGHGPHSSKLVVIVLCHRLHAVCCYCVVLLFVLFCYYLCCSMYWFVYCNTAHRVLTQLQLTNISYHINCINTSSGMY